MLPLSVHMVAWPSTRLGLSAAAQLGFQSAEVFALALWADDPADVTAWLTDTGVTLSAVFLDLPEDPAAAGTAAARAAAGAARFGASRLIVTARGAAEPTDALSAAGAACAAVGVRLCLHPHQGTAVETADQMASVLAATNPDHVWACADTGHLLAAGDDPAAAVAAWTGRLAAVHLKDIDTAGRVVPPGTGRLRLAETLAAIDTAVGNGASLEHLTLELEGYDDPGPALLACAAAVRSSFLPLTTGGLS